MTLIIKEYDFLLCDLLGLDLIKKSWIKYLIIVLEFSAVFLHNQVITWIHRHKLFNIVKFL